MQITIETLLAADLAAAGTIDVTYPVGFEESHFSNVDHKIAVKNGGLLLQGRDFGITFAKTKATVTLATGMATILAGTTLFVEMHLKGFHSGLDLTTLGAPGGRISGRQTIECNFGAPAAAVTTGVTTAQILGAAGNLTIDGTLALSGAVTLDVPRNLTLTVATTNQSGVTFTAYGTDEYGNALIETITGPNNNTVQGKKAFKKVTRVAASAAVATNGVSVGFGDILGVPCFLPNSVNVLYDTEDDAAVTDGTYVAGVLTKPTATTGDVRGTYDPNSACDGAKRFSIVFLTDDPAFLGVPQYAG